MILWKYWKMQEGLLERKFFLLLTFAVLDLREDKNCWPRNLKFLSSKRQLPSILTSSNKKIDRISRIVNYLAQDLIYNVSVGRKRVPKYAQLGLTVKWKAGSVITIRWLNRFGHSTLYGKINATEATLAEEHLHNENARRYVTNNIQPGMLVTFVYDNSDHNAESIYNVTLQGTNGRAIQAGKHEFNGIVLHIYEALTSRRRSLKSFPQEIQPCIKSKHQPNPLPIQNLENDLNMPDG